MSWMSGTLTSAPAAISRFDHFDAGRVRGPDERCQAGKAATVEVYSFLDVQLDDLCLIARNRYTETLEYFSIIRI